MIVVMIRCLVILGLIVQPLAAAAQGPVQGAEIESCMTEAAVSMCCCEADSSRPQSCECSVRRSPSGPEDSPAVPSGSVRDGAFAGLLIAPLIRIDLAQDVEHPQLGKGDPGILGGETPSIQSILCVWLT